MKKIILIRHGESQSNVNRSLHYEKDRFDFLIELTEKGKDQANECGKKLNSELNDGSFSVMVSPYLRARQTWDVIAKHLASPSSVSFDGRLREQEFKDFNDAKDWQDKKERAKKRGKLYYRYKNAESGYDVLSRVGGFYNQLRMDIMLNNHPDTIVIVCHEIVIRCFLILALGLDPEHYETMYIDNCELISLTAKSNLKFEKKKSDESR